MLIRRTEESRRTAFLEMTASGFLNVSDPAAMAKAAPDLAELPAKVTASLKLERFVQKPRFEGYGEVPP